MCYWKVLAFFFPRELVSFNPRHITGSPPIENVFELGGIAKAA